MFKIAMILLGLLSYTSGFLSYVYYLQLVFDQSLKSDLGFVILITLFGFLGIACPIYVGIVYFVDKKFKKFKLLLYPLACVAIFFIPTLLALLLWGGISPFSPEAQNFYFFYLSSGIVFGVGYRIIQKMKLGSFYKSSNVKDFQK
ncbi:hypothetical protein [Saccharibacillus alkalitolerans]|uniref:Lipoprotein n=1 Tax=Saccharibacillus alkalitolerans TaxID=2705290 RepID=A0ABX0FBY1_9BACL|nr:hypothetical protein [Saccharibacillus alkalitolerans]NGZ77915.1 hypothetical protein [Saccharibacillus alkalitolerans]